MSNCQRELIAYGLYLFAKVTKEASPIQDMEVTEFGWASQYEAVLGDQQPPPELLPSIFSFVDLPSLPSHSQKIESNPSKQQKYIFPHPFEITDKVFCACDQAEAIQQRTKQNWSQFYSEFSKIKGSEIGKDDLHFFEAFYHLFRRWAWCLPALSGSDGISLFEQWKTVAAMVFAAGDSWREINPDRTYTLVGGDIPGIQDFVYTITSKGATRGLRGRSFFIQLLGDAVIQALLDALGLSSVNIVYSAGGNFMLLAPEITSIAQKLQDISLKLEKSLLKYFEGDLTVCLASEKLTMSQIGTHEFADPVSRKLKEKIAAQKQRRFSQTAVQEWSSLFAPQGKPGNKHCVICQRMLTPDQGIEMQSDRQTDDDAKSYRCPACDGFQELAKSLARAAYWVISLDRPGNAAHWQIALHDICGYWYRLDPEKPMVSPSIKNRVYLVNQTNFAGKAHGFRLIANATPYVTKNDLGQDFQEDRETPPRIGDIRTFSMLADASSGIHQVGVLRMDVDNLGSIMVRGLANRSLAATSTLSAALDRFFTGWLNEICRIVNYGSDGSTRGERLYAIYAGGDDLFVVGSWDLMPELAYRIQQALTTYTGGNPSLHISGGVSMESRKFPLYQAAEHAGGAEKKAKDYRFNNQEKNAFCFLDEAVCWSEWEKVLVEKDLILRALEEGAPKAILQTIQEIYAQFIEQQRKATAWSEIIQFGPWMWRAAYAFTQMNDRISTKKPSLKQSITNLQKSATTYPSIRYLALAARWVELLNREENK